MGDLDEISRAIGQLEGRFEGFSKQLTTVTEQNGKIIERLDGIPDLCAHHAKDIEDLKKKDVLGGTSKFEKIILALTAIGLALKSFADFFNG